MIEFVESEHLYLWDGVITPSVTQIVAAVLGNQYSAVPPAILAAKAHYGVIMHELCEDYVKTRQAQETVVNDDLRASYEQFAQIVDELKVKPLYTETVVGYAHKVCGRFDLLAEIGGKITLIDYKTTARYNADYLSIQETIYAMAIKETLGVDVEQLGCIWLPKKHKARYKPVEWYGTARIDQLLAEYEINYAD